MSAVRSKTEHRSTAVLFGTVSSEAQCFWANCAMYVSLLLEFHGLEHVCNRVGEIARLPHVGTDS